MTCATKRHFPTKLVVRNLSPNTTVESLQAMFENYGAVLGIKIMTDVMTGRCGGVAVITLEENVVGAAMNALDDSQRNGRTLRVSLERKPLRAADYGDHRSAR